MTDEDRQRMMEFILAQQAQFWASMQKREESQAAWQAKHEEWQKRAEVGIDNGSFRVDRVERILKLMIKAGQRARRQMHERDEKLDRRFAEVAEMIAAGERAQARTERKLESLLELVREQRNGSA
jgi:hypothetical protein